MSHFDHIDPKYHPEDDGYPRDQIHDLILDASSGFYVEFGTLISARVDEWLDTLIKPSEMEDGND